MTSVDSAKLELLDEIKQISQENNNEPLYSSFVRWVCANILDITDESDIEDAISLGGSNDYDVDFFIHKSDGDEDEQYMSWGQVKFSETFSYSVTRSEMETFGKTLDYLKECPASANSMFKDKSKLFNDLGGKEAPIGKKMYFIVAGDLNDQTKELIQSEHWKRTLENLRGPKIYFQVITLVDILEQIITPQTDTLKIKFQDHTLNRKDEHTQKESVIGYVLAKDLANVVNSHPGLFGLNVRESLGKDKPTFKGMTTTLKDPIKKKQFWKFNNGITAVCNKLEKIGINPPEYEIQNFKVVNGRQTTYCLANNESLLDSVIVGLTIHETTDADERTEISISTNTQNPVKPVDLFSNDEAIYDLAIQCRHKFHDFYFERQTKGFEALSSGTKSRITKKRLLDKNKTARSFLAYSNNPNEGIISESKLFSPESQYFETVFVNRDIKDLIIPHCFKQMLDGLDFQWTKDIGAGDLSNKRNKQILHKDITKYFVLNLIGVTMNEITTEDRTKIEEKIIELMLQIRNREQIPAKFVIIAEKSFKFFLSLFNQNKDITWPDELYQKIKELDYVPNPSDIPTDFEIMTRLKSRGPIVRQTLLNSRSESLEQGNVDVIKKLLLELIDSENIN
jgi:hypothetical protein